MYAPFLFDASEQDINFVLLHENGHTVYPMHWHKEIEITYAVKGSFEVIIDGRKIMVDEGDAVIINSSCSHFYSPSDADMLTAIFSPDIVRDSSNSNELENEIVKRLGYVNPTTKNWILQDKEKVRFIMERLSILTPDSYGRSLDIRAGIFEILYLFSDSGHNPGTWIPETLDDDDERIKEKIEKAFKYIEDNYSRQLCLAEVAKASGYVPTYFARVFKNYTGMTFYEYFTSYRMSKAQVALIYGGGSIVDVATSCGFNSVKTFDRVFKESFGISPLKFRKKYSRKQS